MGVSGFQVPQVLGVETSSNFLLTCRYQYQVNLGSGINIGSRLHLKLAFSFLLSEVLGSGIAVMFVVKSSFAPNPSNQYFSGNEDTGIIRNTANFHPSIWGDHFISNPPSDMMNRAYSLEQVEDLKKEVRRMLVVDANEFLNKKLSLIDLLQRLGVAYHFEGEMEKALEQIYNASDYGFDDDDNYNLYTVALQFRLLRQQGYNVPCDVFNRFKSSDGKFKEDLINDVRGLLCLYEATHLRVHGEDILDEALDFTTTRLKYVFVTDDLKPHHPLATQVMHALRQPLHKVFPARVEARRYISVYQEDNTKNEYVLKLAKLDFNLLQSIYLQELSQLSIWWKELGIAQKLPYARDRMVECYFLMLGLYFEPHYALARKIVTKTSALLTIVDDTYDAYGNLQELQLFTDAIESWDLGSIDQLPEYMKVLYSALLYVYSETEEELKKEGRSYRVNYAKEVMKAQVRSYLKEAKWFNKGYIPTFEEYMQNASKSSAVTMVILNSLLGMGDVVTKEVLDWVMNERNKLLNASSLITRLMDDMVTNKAEQERGHVCSAIECYIKQYGVSEQEVHDEFSRRVVDAWKDINEECLKPTDVPMPVLLRCVNLTRIVDTIYKDKDSFTLAHEVLKEPITSLLFDPILMSY
ncbi:(-)-germacrene D synthase-like [Macadamia integrifolia]|uniref:(-)-germacrene D synthase-like n=1 Tax=Macadamia integrifolia TaxID=60698 RepID=UPI001C52D60E|nr:(-)-germacrene D synthase-like [Macadamia integrifolia]